jgi:hypothetical protein
MVLTIPPLSFSIRYPGRVNVIKTQVHIGIPILSPIKSRISLTECNAKEFSAIWDTGATNCVITQKVIDECNIPAIGRAKVNTVSGEDETTVHLVSLFLPNRLVIPNVRMTKGKMVGGDVLIGMDIINRGDFALTNKDGVTMLSFRQPSQDEIDFTGKIPARSASNVVPSNLPNSITPPTPTIPKVSRNALCPCGSGLKYKRCHGK